MSNINIARAKWEAKTQNAGAKWKRNTVNAAPKFQQGIADFFQVSPGAVNTEVVANYGAGVGRVSEADFQSAVAGKGDKWERNLRDSMLG